MKDMGLGQKVRWIAGGLYLVLAVYQVACVHNVVVQGTFADMGVVALLAIGLVGAATAMAIWMFSSKDILGTGAHRAVIVGTVVAVCYQLLTYKGQAGIIQGAWQAFTGSGDNTPGLLLGALVFVRLLLLILAAFFVLSSRPAPLAEEAADDEPADDEPETEFEPADTDAGE